MIGLEFKVKNEYNNFLFKILNSIDVQQHIWMIITDDIIFPKGGNNDGIFDSDIVEGQIFLNCIAKDEYYMIFVDLKAFPVCGKQIEIKSFKDFMDSDCQMILLCVDSEHIEFYSKDEAILKTVFENCLKYGFESVKHISEKEAHKRSMVAF